MGRPPTKTPEILSVIGREKVSIADLPDLQIDFLSELRNSWQYTYERELSRDNLAEKLKITERETVVLEKATNILKVMLWIRKNWASMVLRDHEMLKSEIAECKKDFFYWADHWLYIHETRMTSYAMPTKLPFVMYPKQRETIKAMDEMFKSRQNVFIEKSRGVGISWGFDALILHKWLTIPGFRVSLGSANSDKVDVIGSSNPLFGKIRYMIYNLPHKLRPKTYENMAKSPNDKLRALLNPENSSEILGEIGDNIGRSGRYSMVIIDESQDIENPDLLDASLESTTFTRCDVGTPRGMNHFGQLRFSGRVHVETIGWWNDPRLNPKWKEGVPDYACAWRKYTELTKDPVIIAQEYDIDYQASVEGLVIEKEWIKSAVDFGLNWEGPRYGGFDLASSGKNKSVYIARTGPVAHLPREMAFRTSTEAIWGAVDQGEEDNIAMLSYDQDGIGESAYGQFATSERPIKFKLNGIHGNATPTKRMVENEGVRACDKYYNKRAELWMNLRQRFKNTYEVVTGIKFHAAGDCISIPNHTTLINQLSYPKKMYTNNGKIKVESKIDMRKRGLASPDYADALVYSFDVPNSEDSVVSNLDYTDKSNHFSNFYVDVNTGVWEYYISVYQHKDFSTSIVGGRWRPHKSVPMLQIYAEYSEANANAKDAVNLMLMNMRLTRDRVNQWVGNSEMMDGMTKGKVCPYHLYKKEGVILHKNWQDDPSGSVMTVSHMLQNNMMQIHTDCKVTMLQLSTWQSTNTGVDKSFGCAMALSQLVTRLKKRGYADILSGGRKPYNMGMVMNAEVTSDKLSIEEVLRKNFS